MNRFVKYILFVDFVLVLPCAIYAQGSPTNQKPIFVSRAPAFSGPHYPNIPYYFWVSAYDPDGDTLTFSWRLDLAIVQTGRDSTFTMIFTDPTRTPQRLTCIFSDPGGLKDSTTWSFGFLAVPDERSLPLRFALYQNYPNPFNPATTISFQIPASNFVRLRIFNSVSQVVATLVEGQKDAGFYTIDWEANASSGVYFYLLEAGLYFETRKMLLIK